MRVALKKTWLPIAATSVVLLSALGFLYAKTQGSGESDHFENVALLRQIKQLDAQWELEVLKSRIGLNTHYDPLTASLVELQKPLAVLGVALAVKSHEQAEALRENNSMLLEAIRQKESLIELFKSNNSVLRNALASLPAAAQDVHEAVGRRAAMPPSGAAHVANEVNMIQVLTMLYSQNASRERSVEIRKRLGVLEKPLYAVSPALSEGLGIFGAHVRTVLREQNNVNDLLAAITEIPTAARIDDIGNILNGEQRNAEARSKQYRVYLLSFSAALMALLLVAAYRLLHGAAAINRVNRELHSANENLERRVQERNQELRQITDAVSAMIFYVDHEGRYRFHNKAAEVVLGLNADQIEGFTVQEVCGEELYEILRPWIEKVMAGVPVRFETLRKDALGIWRDYSVRYFPRYEDGREDLPVIGYYGMVSEITDLKHIDRMKTEFISTVSHELRTPLTSIQGSLGLIAGGVTGKLPAAAKKLVDLAKSNCERLTRLINNILDTEKIESGNMEFVLHVVELRPLVAQSIAANEGFAVQLGVTIALLPGDDAPRVNADSDGVSQVLTNLLSNAVKFSPAGASVDVSVAQSGHRVRVEVRDRGPGIPKEFHGRIFEKFSQADSSDSRQKGGTGLGLNISRAIVERLGGTIGFADHADGGTVFFFDLPEWHQTPERPCVLVCEDNHDIAELLAMMLDRLGYDTQLCHAATEARELAVARPYAAMTVDLDLPDQNGIALIRLLRDDVRTRDLPIVVVSANCEEGRASAQGEGLDISAWLGKPIDVDRLELAMRGAVAGRVPQVVLLPAARRAAA